MSAITKTVYAAFAVVTLAVVALTVNAAPGDLFATISGGPGNGVGSIYKYTPAGVQSTFASGLNRPRGLAFDSAGNLLVATTFCEVSCQVTILKIAPDGAQNVFGNLPGNFLGQGLAIDSSDNVFVMTQMGNVPALAFSAIYKFTPAGVRTRFATLPAHPVSQGFAVVFDSTGNLFAADAQAGTIYTFAPDGTRSIFVGPEAFIPGLEDGPVSLAFDHFGNLFVSTERFPFTDDRILRFTPSGVKSTFVTGLARPRGLVFDISGNLFVGESPPFVTGNILKFAPDGTLTVFASGIGSPQGFGGPQFLVIQP